MISDPMVFFCCSKIDYPTAEKLLALYETALRANFSIIATKQIFVWQTLF